MLLATQPCQETFYFYATKTPDPLLEKLETKHLQGFQPLPDHIITYLSSKKRATVSSHQAGTYHLKVCRGGCIHVITFEHQ